VIYKATNVRTIRQGDIFVDLPFIDLEDFNALEASINLEDEPQRKTWTEIKNQDNIHLTVKAVPTSGIVISQDCDNVRKKFISFAKIDTLVNVLGKPTLPANQNELLSLMIKTSPKRGYSFYYLPEGIGFTTKMAADFKTIFQLPRESLLNNLASMRKGTLNKIALEHFRQTLAQYFTRYAYNEWYSLNLTEYQAYYRGLPQAEKRNVTPFPHQRRQ